MKMKKLSYLFTVMVLSFGFISCGGDDKDPVMGDKSDLLGLYSGKEDIRLTDITRVAANQDATVRFERNSQDTNVLTVALSDLGTGVLASNFRISKEAYTFNLASVNLTGLQGNEVPGYIREWFAGDYDSLEKVDIKLNATNGKYDRLTESMEITYRGSLTIYPKVGSTSPTPVTYQIEFKYYDLKK